MQLLTDTSRMAECKNGFLLESQSRKDKLDKEKATAEDMRRKATEKFSEMQERYGEATKSKRRKVGVLIDYLKSKEEANKENFEKEFTLRQELNLQKQQLENQKELQQQNTAFLNEQLGMKHETQKAMLKVLQSISCAFVEKHP